MLETTFRFSRQRFLKSRKHKPEAQVLKLHQYKPEAQASGYFQGFADSSLARRACIETLHDSKLTCILANRTRNHISNVRLQIQRSRVLVVAALIVLLQCISSVEVMGQSSVREVNAKRQIPSFLTRPFARFAGSSLESDDATTGTTELVDDAFFVQYETQLNAILKTRLNEEKEFVRELVDQVRAENVSTRLINTSFKWVRNKRPNVKNSFVYFERVLRILANNQGVGQFIPDFDANIYSQTSTSTLP